MWPEEPVHKPCALHAGLGWEPGAGVALCTPVCPPGAWAGASLQGGRLVSLKQHIHSAHDQGLP